jgi:hypothetical protein
MGLLLDPGLLAYADCRVWKIAKKLIKEYYNFTTVF